MRRFRRRQEQRADLLVEVAQGRVVRQEYLLDVSQTLLHLRALQQVLPHLYERPDDENAHLDCWQAVKHVGGHDRAMLGEDIG